MRFPFVSFFSLVLLFLFFHKSQATSGQSPPSPPSPPPSIFRTRPIGTPPLGLCSFPFGKQQLSQHSMEPNTGSVVQSTSYGTTSTTSSTGGGVGVTTTAAATAAAVSSASTVSPVRIGATTPGPANSGTYPSSASGVAAAAINQSMPSNSCHQQQQQIHQQTTSLIIDSMKPEDFNNLSLASGISEGQRSLSGAPSASSSPILSPPGKIFGRNANGTMIATSRPNNEAEVQLYRVLQRASLLSYYDTLLEMGGDDVQQLYEAGEEEFLEIMALVGMASKPLHVRRLQKALHEWANNPALFQGPLMSTPPTGFCETPTKSAALAFNPETSPAIFARIKKLSTFNPQTAFNPTPLISTAAQTQSLGSSSSSSSSATHLLTHAAAAAASCSPAVSMPVIQPQSSPMVAAAAAAAASLPLPSAAAAAAAALAASALASHQPSGSQGGAAAHQVSSSSPQLTPVLTELQVTRITLGAEKIANQLPQREPRAQTSKKRTSRELEQVIAMSENDPRRMEEIRKYSAIYGRFDCKRRPEKPLTLHEVCVNEAAAQLCRLVPALLTRRDELFPLARQIVKDAGFGHSASIARYGGLLPQISMQTSTAAAATSSSSSSSITAAMGGIQRSSALVDCESSDSTMSSSKRQRLSSTETKPVLELNREFNEDSRYNLFAMYQKFAKPPFDLSDIAKFSLGKADYDDNENDNDNNDDNDNDSRFSFSNSSNSPTSMPPHNGNGANERALITRCLDNMETDSSTDVAITLSSSRQTNLFIAENSNSQNRLNESCSSAGAANTGVTTTTTIAISTPTSTLTSTSTPFGDVQVISAAAAGHIIAVANPALVMSAALNETAILSLKREAETPDNQ